MPIPVTKIDEALRPLQDRIYDVLSRDPGNAYDLDEIYAAVTGTQTRDATAGMSESARSELLEQWARAILELAHSGRIEKVKFDGKYYCFVRTNS